jgi:hypothetical protein
VQDLGSNKSAQAAGPEDGGNGDAGDTDPADAAEGSTPVPFNPAACPNVRPVSESIVVTSEGDVRARSIGQWAFCHGERDYTGKGPLDAVWNGSQGIEFAEENGKWVYYFLRDTGGSLARDTSLAGHGWVTFLDCMQDANPAGCDINLNAEDGIADAQMRLRFWANPDAFMDWVYDIYDFARVTPGDSGTK